MQPLTMTGMTAGALALLVALSAPPASAADNAAYNLVEPGILSVAITGDMPGLVARDGKLVG
ncbi:hypothetical protein WGT02_35400 (plasmid) [Rhizobium sp. T1470]|nr:hypothetical protein [Rhizobium sp. T1473]MCA0806589.1 hypothetical protein [Rhizobium sp. T1473]